MINSMCDDKMGEWALINRFFFLFVALYLTDVWLYTSGFLQGVCLPICTAYDLRQKVAFSHTNFIISPLYISPDLYADLPLPPPTTWALSAQHQIDAEPALCLYH